MTETSVPARARKTRTQTKALLREVFLLFYDWILLIFLVLMGRPCRRRRRRRLLLQLIFHGGNLLVFLRELLRQGLLRRG